MIGDVLAADTLDEYLYILEYAVLHSLKKFSKLIYNEYLQRPTKKILVA